MRKYLAAFRLALSREFVYRTNFLVGRLRALLVYIAIIYLYLAIPEGVGSYSQDELLTYIVLGTVFAAVIFYDSMERIAYEIVEGDLANFLLRPISYFGYWFARNSAVRLVLIVSGFLEAGLMLTLFPKTAFFVQQDIVHVLQAIVLLAGAVIAVQLINFLGGMTAFWAHRSFGPRWLILTMTRFASGAIIPIDVFPAWITAAAFATPFPFLIFVPMQAYFGLLSPEMFVQALLMQWAWIGALGVLLTVLWRFGVKHYAAAGR